MKRVETDGRFVGWGRAAAASVVCIVAGAGSVIAQPCGTPQWTEADPHPFGEYSMVYDSARDVVVALVNGVTWESPDAQHWVRRTDAGPGARSGAALVYDEVRGVCLLFGGFEPPVGQTHGDTWQWDGSEWAVVANTGPGPRYAHAMAYDSAAGRVVLFGGRTTIFSSGTELGDTWVWNGAAWSLLTDVGPSPRLGSAMGFDSDRQRIVLAGGSPTVGNRPETWEFIDGVWSLRDVTSDAGRSTGLPLVYDPVRRVTVAFTGLATWEWNGQYWEERDVMNAQGYRPGAGMTYYPPGKSVVLSGGTGSQTATLLDRFWAWDGDAWRPRGEPAVRPVRRVWAAMAYDTARGRSVMHGGFINYGGGSDGATRETWEWDGAQWVPRGSDGPAVMRHAMAYDSARGVTVLFGGENRLFSDNPADDTWEWDGAAWELVASAGPPPSVSDPMCFDAARGVCVLVHNGETWEWDGVAWVQRLATGSPGSSGSAMAYDADRGVSVLFGGEGEYPYSRDETWEWDGDLWVQKPSPTAPDERFQAALVYDTVRRRTVLFGGTIIAGAGDRMGLGDSAEWDGAAWTLLGEYGPSPRGASAAAYDSARGELVLFSGVNELGWNFSSEDTWVRRSNDLGTTPVVVAAPQDLAVPEGDAASFSVVAEGAGALTYQWRRNAVPLQDALPFIGVRSPTLTIIQARSPHAGEYDVVITNECGPTTSAPATLDVLHCRVDFNVDGILNSQDYFDFLTAFFAGSPEADFDGSGVLDPADFFSFLDAFFHPAC